MDEDNKQELDDKDPNTTVEQKDAKTQPQTRKVVKNGRMLIERINSNGEKEYYDPQNGNKVKI